VKRGGRSTNLGGAFTPRPAGHTFLLTQDGEPPVFLDQIGEPPVAGAMRLKRNLYQPAMINATEDGRVARVEALPGTWEGLEDAMIAARKAIGRAAAPCE
jgi:hypothetical protein